MKDEQLMEMVKNDDLDKAAVLFDRYHKPLYNFFVKITFDRDLGHDLTQNLFLRMLKYRKTFRNEHAFRPWIYQMARNVYADHYRKNKVMFSDYNSVDQVSTKLESVDQKMVANEEEKLLYVALYRLNPDQREVLVLTRFHELKYEEVASILNTTVANVKVKVYRAMKALREVYVKLDKN